MTAWRIDDPVCSGIRLALADIGRTYLAELDLGVLMKGNGSLPRVSAR